MNLLRACCGMQPLPMKSREAITGSSISETWKSSQELDAFNRYLLLLEPKKPLASINACCDPLAGTAALPISDSSTVYSSKKLILELLSPKLGDLEELCTSWTKKTNEGGVQISFDRFQSLLSACLIGAMLLTQVGDLNSTQSSSVEPTLTRIIEKGVESALNSVEPSEFVNLILRTIRPCMANLDTASCSRMLGEDVGLLRLITNVWALIDHRKPGNNSGDQIDLMDLDDEFDSQSSGASSNTTSTTLPRMNTQLCMDSHAFYADTKARLRLFTILRDDVGQLGLVPEAYIDQLMDMPTEELLLCQKILIEIFHSDLVATPDVALRIIERLGDTVSQLEYQCCEVALTTCIEVIEGLHHVWLNDQHDLAESVGDFYNHFIKTCLPSNIFSPVVQISMTKLLFTLLKADPEYASSLGLDSCRTSLFYILTNSPMVVKYTIGERIADIFDLFILLLHDEVFVDVLDSLPATSEDTSGIAFRLLVLSKLACRWPTLLRRCTYHIFETPGTIAESVEYATRCLAQVSDALHLESPRELFGLFSQQLLYTWLDSDPLKGIPFSIFGFASLEDLLRSAQAEATGLTIMRGQQTATSELAQILGLTENDLIRGNFTTAIAYSMMYGDFMGGEDKGVGEDYIQKKLGKKAFIEAVYIHFVDIVALFFDLIDQENPIEKYFKRQNLEYAAEIMAAIKGIAHSPADLPPNQQPSFKARFLIQELVRHCQRTEFQFHDLWTPALVVTVARKLLNTVHPALGPLHACAVLRKVRILICLAGPVVLESYPLEMLLNSTDKFLVDSECADDAMGISQYLLAEGAQHLSQAPSFLAGYALSTLASLRVFLESSQASTTQESQFKATMSKAQQFHEWLSKYLDNYNSPGFSTLDQGKAFKSITQSAARIRSSGNAEKDTAESKLLLEILQDEGLKKSLLNDTSRQVALGLLCGDFTIPTTSQDDIIESDSAAMNHAAAIWKSCNTDNLSNNYLAWAGRVVGRSFSASGEIPGDVLRESRLGHYRQIAPGANGSEMGLLYLLQNLTSSSNSVVAGLAEAALRTTVSQSVLLEDEPLVVACQKTLTESLFLSSQWGSYRSPPSDKGTPKLSLDEEAVWAEDISTKRWLPQLSAHLAQSMPDSIILSVLSPILAQVEDFAESAFPFVVHLVLFFQLEQQQALKRALSGALKEWLKSSAPSAKENIKLLVNTILYLRTQQYPKESSIADRSHWLDIDYPLAASAASQCGMHKTALLFAELVSEGTRSSRRSSAVRETDMSETLLTIFENIDDPDAYYGLPEDASLTNVLARVEYENDGSKTLAFRGAQYDSNIRSRNSTSISDGQVLVKALNTLGLSGLSHSLLQTQQNLDATPASLDSTFGTARKLEIWNLPAPASDHHAVTVYKAYQSIHQATDISFVRSALRDGFSRTMRSLLDHDLNATTLRSRLGALASLTELDDMLGVSDNAEMQNILLKFKNRSEWMRRGL